MHSFVCFCFFTSITFPHPVGSFFMYVVSKTGDGGDDNGGVNDCNDGDRSCDDEDGMGAILMRQD